MKSIEDSILEHYQLDSVPSILVEQYSALIESDRFSVDPVVIDLRPNPSSLHNKINYILEDESIVSISTQTRDKLQDLFSYKYSVIEYMNESKDNFFNIIQLII
jgi:predicted GNAT superfamily acetyltransferase